MSRNNKERSGAKTSAGSQSPQATMANPMDFVAPTEYVELPSMGNGYMQGHPLHNQETIEIKFMTAKEEDILSSRSLLKKGLAIERLIESVICDKNIMAKDLLVGDRNAILIAARRSAYGNIYSTKVTCPNCTTVAPYDFDLNNAKLNNNSNHDKYNIEITPAGLFKTTLPLTEFQVEFRLLRGRDESEMIMKSQKKTKNKSAEENVSDHVVNNMPAQDSIFLRGAYRVCSPDIKISDEFACPSCGFEQELEVPFGADFFWPDR